MTTYTLLDQFTDYNFDDSLHKYTYKGNPVKTYVTQLIDTFQEPFDKDYWSKKKAKDRGITQEEILAEWQRKSDISANTGTQFHAFMENSLAGKNTPIIPIDDNIKNEVLQRYELLKPLGSKFINDSRHNLIPIKSEVIIGLQDKIAGQIDQLFFNKASNEIEVWDWKTNKEIKTKNSFRKNMLKEFCNYNECEFIHYSIQLGIYKEILFRQGFIIGRCYFVWFNENNINYECFECIDLSGPIRRILDKL